MRTCAVVVVLLVATARADETPKPLLPEEAAKKVNEKCTVEMEVKSVGMARDGKIVFLNSESEFRSAKNFTVMLNEQAVEKLKKAKVEDPGARYKGKTVRVTGTVKLYRDKPEIVVENPDDIVIVEKK